MRETEKQHRQEGDLALRTPGRRLPEQEERD